MTCPLSSYMVRQKMSPFELARHLRLADSIVYRLLHGQRLPSLETALHIERVTDGAVKASDWIPPRRRSRRTA